MRPARVGCTIPCKEQAGNREGKPAVISHSRKLVLRLDQSDRRPGRAQREPGPITTGGDHGSPLSRGRHRWPKWSWLRFAKMLRALMLRSRAAQASLRCGASRSMRTAELAARRRTVFGNSRLTMSNSPSRSRGAFLRPGFATLLHSPRTRGGRSAEKRSGAQRNTRGARHLASKTRVNALMTRQARRLRGALRPMTRDARLSALHRGGFGLPGPRFRLLGRPPSYNGGQLPCGSVQRARSAWRAGSLPPEASGYEPPAAGRHSPLRLQDRLRRRPSMSEDGKLCIIASRRSQERS
jgi:hypothetical protein